MRHLSLPTSIFTIACGLLANAAPARAVPQTWVSATGSDGGSCQFTAPCRTFQYAHSRTTSRGAINVISSGEFGPLTITKSISIVADGVEALISASTGVGAAAVVVDGAGIQVALQGLTIDLAGVGGHAISSFPVTQVSRSVVVNNKSLGIGAFGASATIRIGNSTVSGNGTGLAFAGGAITSYGTNKVNGNGTDGAPTNTVTMK